MTDTLSDLDPIQVAAVLAEPTRRGLYDIVVARLRRPDATRPPPRSGSAVSSRHSTSIASWMPACYGPSTGA